MISIQFDRAQIAYFRQMVAASHGDLKEAIQSGVDQANKLVARAAVEMLVEEITAPEVEIEKRVVVNPVTGDDIAKASVTIVDQPKISMRHFEPEQTKVGVTIRAFRKRRGRYLIAGAFGPDIPRLGNGIWKRRTKKRLPIRKLSGLSLANLGRIAGVEERLRVVAMYELDRALRRQIVSTVFLGGLARDESAAVERARNLDMGRRSIRRR